MYNIFFSSEVINKNNKYISDLPGKCNTFKELQVLLLFPALLYSSLALFRFSRINILWPSLVIKGSMCALWSLNHWIHFPTTTHVTDSVGMYSPTHQKKQRCSQSHWQSLSRCLRSMECISSAGSFLVILQSQPGALQIHWGLCGWIARASAVWTVTPRTNYTARNGPSLPLSHGGITGAENDNSLKRSYKTLVPTDSSLQPIWQS